MTFAYEVDDTDDDKAENTSLFRCILERKLRLELIPSLGARSLVQAMLAVAPKDRITADDALSHPWLIVGEHGAGHFSRRHRCCLDEANEGTRRREPAVEKNVR